MLGRPLVLDHEGVHPGTDFARSKADVLRDAVVKRNLRKIPIITLNRFSHFSLKKKYFYFGERLNVLNSFN